MLKMVRCIKCNGEFIPSKGLINYCSLKCRNSRILSDDVKLKISKSMKSSIKRRAAATQRSLTFDYKAHAQQLIKTWNDRLLATPFDMIISTERKRKRVILDQDGKCARCGIDKWNGKQIVLELDHINGDRSDNSRQNLECLCPNCHSQTPTWRGRNVNKSVRITDDALIKAFCATGNIHRALIQVGMSPRGANYKRLKQLITSITGP